MAGGRRDLAAAAVRTFRALIGFRSDIHKSVLGWRRVPYLWFGSLMQFGGLAILPFALLVVTGQGQGDLGAGRGGVGVPVGGAGLPPRPPGWRSRMIWRWKARSPGSSPST